MKTVAIVQARHASTRLPGKALLPLGGRSVLRRVLDRCARIEGVDAVICATADSPDCDAIAREAADADYHVSRGPERDVLSRYAKAASEAGADVVLRITSDCPFIDPGLCARTLALLDDANADYSCNDLPASWPHGLDCEAFSARLLHWADNLATEPGEREHVTPWMRAHPRLRKASLTGPGGQFAALRWTLDYAEDYEFACAIYDALGARAAFASAAEIAALCLRRPDIAALNLMRHDQGRLAAPARADVTTSPMPMAEAA